jgi:antitoxin component of MazEF toxin-antitoxin module
MEKTLIDVSHVSKRGSSLRLTLPKKIAEQLQVGPKDIVGFYVDGKIVSLEKMK